ncbi:hypothetical protein D5F95_01200 [Streptococcus agalactiae]|nr:hypothetical protein D5F95_01200 [Streptococcus agalactiae]RRA93323.1 hypothetical protein D5F93_11935 [Streptococcus agalactiae]
MLEPYEGKLSRTVLREEGGSNTTNLLDCRVQDFFFIINSRNSNQSDILSNLITFFITKGNLDRLHELGDNKEKINHYLIEKGVF